MESKILKLTYELHCESENKFVGWLNEVEGVIAQGETETEVREELLKILRVKWELERQEKAKSHRSNESTKTEDLNLQIADKSNVLHA